MMVFLWAFDTTLYLFSPSLSSELNCMISPCSGFLVWSDRRDYGVSYRESESRLANRSSWSLWSVSFCLSWRCSSLFLTFLSDSLSASCVFLTCLASTENESRSWMASSRACSAAWHSAIEHWRASWLRRSSWLSSTSFSFKDYISFS